MDQKCFAAVDANGFSEASLAGYEAAVRQTIEPIYDAMEALRVNAFSTPEQIKKRVVRSRS